MDEENTPISANEYRAQRIENLEALKTQGHRPFGQRFDRTGRLDAISEGFEEGKQVKIAGRIVAMRVMGKASFATLKDATGSFQVFLKKDLVGEASYDGIKQLDLGDHIGVEGELFTTKTGEPTVRVSSWTILSKALLPLPEKFHGLTDTEARYRQRYLDLISNDDSLKVFKQRIAIVRELRNYLEARAFMEVETPMMQSQAGGAAATPFATHYNALGIEMFLRIAPELYLKRLLVGGLDKVYELNRNFRNEGLSRSHNPEFTMVEIYEAYGDRRSMAELVEGLVRHLAETVIGSLTVGTESEPVNLDNWREVEYETLIKEKAGDDYFDLTLEQQRARAIELGCHIDDTWNAIEVGQEIFEKLIEKTLIDPTFVTRLPAQLVPLAKPCEDDPAYVDVFELNDPLIQRAALEAQSGAEAQAVDEAFITALEHGMPPAGGMGIGIDRLVMMLTGAESIRDVILFPQMKPKSGV
jgi:lysyl-tRNA synthetase, class II